MKLPTRISHGVRLLCDIACNSGGGALTQINSISRRQGISTHYIQRILYQLKTGGIVRSTTGPTGGYYLAKRPEDISIGDVIRAVDRHDLRLVPCSGDNRSLNKACQRYGKCVVSDVWSRASKTLMDYLDSVTLDDLCVEARTREVRGIGG